MLLSDSDIQQIQSIKEASEQVLVRHEQVSAAISIQAAVRGFLVRKRLSPLLSMMIPHALALSLSQSLSLSHCHCLCL
jgi:hypothetical protein